MISHITRVMRGGAVAALFLCPPLLANDGATVDVLDGTPGATALVVTLEEYATQRVDIRGVEHHSLEVEGVGAFRDVGQPNLPRVTNAVVIPDQSAVRAEVVSASYHDVPGVFIAPSRGPIPRTQDPDSVPYTFGVTYGIDAFWPAELVTLREPFVLRDVRGVVAEVNLFQYNPVTHVLRVYDRIEYKVLDAGPGVTNVYNRGSAPDRRDRTFQRIQRNLFVNYSSPTYGPLYPDGDMLIICRGTWVTAMQPLVDWKNSKGINTTIVNVATIGNNPTAIGNYIDNAYDTGNLAYVLLVGDSAHVASPSFSGGKSDPTYSLMDGDWYPDILIGRFSASDTGDVDTQVQRTIEYEQQDHSLDGLVWNRRGIGIASNQGPGHKGEYDDEHMDLIRVQLLAYGFTTVDRVYDYFGTKTDIRNALNQGRRMTNYCGHGSTTSWGTTGFSNSDINNLTNVGMLPFIHSVACVNGAFDYGTCFGEAWLQATHGGEPSGAVGAYMSSINQYWDEPMWAQDESVDLFCDEDEWTMGGLWFGGSAYMMNVAGSSGRDMFMTWHCFGDPSLKIHGDGCDDPFNYCTTSPNSVGSGAVMTYGGSASVAANDLVLVTIGCPPDQFGLFYTGPDPASVPVGDGTMCIGGSLVRFPAQQVDSWGIAENFLDLNNMPGGLTIQAGDLWRYAFWYRDPGFGSAGYNFSDGLAVTFCP